MKQYKITSADILDKADNDCALSPDDPIHKLIPTSMLGGLGSDAALQDYMTLPNSELSSASVIAHQKAVKMKVENIKPGTDAWFKLWFGRN